MKRLLSSILEGMRVARSQVIVSALVAFISAAVVLTALQTTSNSLKAQAAVRLDLEASGSRTVLILDDTGDADIASAAVDRISSLSTVAWVVGFGPVADVTAFPGGTPVAASDFRGTSPNLIIGSASQRRGLLVSAESASSLGLIVPIGEVVHEDGAPEAVVGSFAVSGVLNSVSTRALRLDDDWSGPLRLIVLETRAAADVHAVAGLARSMLGAAPGASIRVEVPTALNDARTRLDSTMVGSGRAAVLITLLAGLVFMCATIFAGVLGRRRDFGRRRALGASRWQLVVVILMQTLTAAVPATLASCAISAAVIGASGTYLSFTAAIGILTLLAGVVASLVPALFVARLDPLKTLRVP